MKNLTFFVFVAVVFLTGISLIENQDKQQSYCYYQVVVVQNGDTLWSIAAKHITQHQDIRQLIASVFANIKVDHLSAKR